MVDVYRAPPKKPCSIPLATPDGEVRAWACGVCARVGAIHGTAGPPDAEQRASIAEDAKADADACCVCRTCGAFGVDMWPRECLSCRATREAKWEAGQAERDAKCAAEEAAAEATFAQSKDPIAAHDLCQRMSDISEDCWCAGWLTGCEFSLWDFMTKGGGDWGQGKVRTDSLSVLRALSERCGGWIAWRDDVGNVFVPLDEWLNAVKTEQERMAHWLAAYEANRAEQATREKEDV